MQTNVLDSQHDSLVFLLTPAFGRGVHLLYSPRGVPICKRADEHASAELASDPSNKDRCEQKPHYYCWLGGPCGV